MILKYVGVVALIIATIGLFTPVVSLPFGADGDSNFTNLVAEGDITAGDDLFVGDDVTISGGSLTLTTSNTATSSLAIGCTQTTATSTATPIRFVFNTAFAGTSTTAGTNSNGSVYWQYGSCPN